MAMILCYKSALQAFRLISGKLPAPCSRKEAETIASEKPSSVLPPALPSIDFSLIDRPIQIVNNSSCRMTNTSEREFHRWKTFPPGSLLHLTEGVYIPSPELLLIQLASTMPTVALICLGFELCGTYPGRDHAGFNLLELTPHTNTKRLATFIEQNPGLRGVTQMKKALPYISDKSASPMETAVFLRLSLPCKLGGYGLPRPLLNHTINFSAREAAICKRNLAVCDLYWPEANLAVEYDSDLHTGSDKIAKDAARRNALLLRGIKVITITKKQMYNAEEFDRAAKVIAHELNARIRPQCANYRAKRAALISITLQGRMLDAPL